MIKAADLANTAASEAPINKKKAEDAERERQAKEASQQNTEPVQSNSYTVRSGDCLWFIAKSSYGDPYKWSQIFNSNTDKITNPDLIYPNQVLVLP